jgi:hypothetical protein
LKIITTKINLCDEWEGRKKRAMNTKRPKKEILTLKNEKTNELSRPKFKGWKIRNDERGK